MIAGKEKIAGYFEDLLGQHGDHYLSLDWKSKDSQTLRFSVLLGIIPHAGKLEDLSILDVGSGIGHLYDFMKEEGLIDDLRINYTGIDIAPKLVDFAKKKHPGVRYQVVDLINDKFDDKFDYVVSSGIFNIRMSDLESHKESVRKMIAKMYSLCEKGLAMNFLASSARNLVKDPKDATSEKFVYFTEEEVISWIRAVSDRFILMRDYHPGDFTVYMLK